MVQEGMRRVLLQMSPERWDEWLEFFGTAIKKKKPKFKLKSGRIVLERQGRKLFHRRQQW